MIKDIQEHNDNVKPSDFELERLRSALPEYFDKDGAFMIDRLKQALSDGAINLSKEGYELKFLGKSYAKYLTSTETQTVVVPDLEHNNKPENKDSENLYIVGDNLDALKHLLGSYAGKVKCIYIDPPYNTGSDGFVYNDDFGFTSEQLIDKIGLSEDEAQRVLDLQGKSSHSAWLTFMYPRLQLAKELLSDDGAIFISIDDNEQSNLKLLCDEVFGEQNFVAEIIWKKRSTPPNDQIIGMQHEPIYVFAKNKTQLALNLRPKSEEQISSYKNPDNHPKGPWRSGDLSANVKGGRFVKGLCYPIINPNTGEEHYPPNMGNWRFNRDRVQELLDNNEIYFGQDGTGRPKLKRFLCDAKDGITWTSLWDFAPLNTQGSAEMEELLGHMAMFDNPKPSGLILDILHASSGPNSIIVDFFSGSGTTAHSVFRLNSEDQGKRKFVLVQLPDSVEQNKPAYEAGYRTIDEIGRERIQRAAAKIKEETGADIDYGFRLYRLEEPSGQVLDQLEAFNPEQTDELFAGDYVSKFDLNGTPGHDTVLATWLVRDGYGLTAAPRGVKLAGYELDVCGDSAYVIDAGLTSADVVELIRLIENGDLEISRVVVFGYSVTFSVMHELKKNLSVLKSGRVVSVIERF